jgi:hypothetical protein
MAKQPGTGGRPSKQMKVILPNGEKLYHQAGSGNPVRTPKTGGPLNNPQPGANLPKNATRKPPVLGT